MSGGVCAFRNAAGRGEHASGLAESLLDGFSSTLEPSSRVMSSVCPQQRGSRTGSESGATLASQQQTLSATPTSTVSPIRGPHVLAHDDRCDNGSERSKCPGFGERSGDNLAGDSARSDIRNTSWCSSRLGGGEACRAASTDTLRCGVGEIQSFRYQSASGCEGGSRTGSPGPDGRRFT